MVAVLAWAWLASTASGDDSPESKAVAYLAAEVPRWSLEHRCYSCHNNGDGARALYTAVRLGRLVPASSTLDTDRWLAGPEGWDKNGGDGPFSDKGLARLQFGSALAAAVGAGRVEGRGPLERAAARLALDQSEDGSWKVDEDVRPGSPATYGRGLATWSAVETLKLADAARHGGRIARAEGWLRGRAVESVMDASTVLLARAYLEDDSVGGFARRDKALEILGRGQSAEGGWGPYVRSTAEPFDTALALMALARHRDRPGVVSLIEKGRVSLVEAQQPDGSWTETTRPAGAESYAQRISTSGWATLALLTVQAR